MLIRCPPQNLQFFYGFHILLTQIPPAPFRIGPSDGELRFVYLKSPHHTGLNLLLENYEFNGNPDLDTLNPPPPTNPPRMCLLMQNFCIAETMLYIGRLPSRFLFLPMDCCISVSNITYREGIPSRAIYLLTSYESSENILHEISKNSVLSEY